MSAASAFVWSIAPFALFGSMFPLRYEARDDHFMLVATVAVSVAIAGPFAIALDAGAVVVATVCLLSIGFFAGSSALAERRTNIARLWVSAIALFTGAFVGHLVYFHALGMSYPVTLDRPGPAFAGLFFGIVGTVVSLAMRLLTMRIYRGEFPRRTVGSFEGLAVTYLTPYVACTVLAGACVASFHESYWWLTTIGFAWITPIHVLASLDLRQRHAAEALRLEAIRQERFVAIGEVSARILHQSRHQVGLIGWSVHRLRAAFNEPGPLRMADIAQELDALQNAKEQLSATLSSELAGQHHLSDPNLADNSPAPEPVQLGELAQRIVDSLDAKANQLGITLSVRDADAHHNSLLVDGALSDAIFNIVDNALDAARTAVGLRIVAAQGRVRVETTDDGEGLTIPRTRAFEPFFTTKAHGTGMGLAIAEAIVSELGGEIAWERNDGITCVTLEFPIQ